MKRFFWIPILFLTGCAQKTQWNASAMKTQDGQYDHKRLVYEVDNRFREVEIELVRIDEMTTVFLNVHASHIPPLEGDEKKAVIQIKTATKEIELIADRLEGGQRLKLPPLASKHLIEMLCNTEHVTLSIAPHYETNLDTAPFKERYREYKRGVKR